MKFPTLVTLLLASLATGAYAQGDSQGKTFSELDLDKDLRVSLNEAEADPIVAGQFATLDQDADGYLDTQEFARVDRRDRDY
ncbi:MAG: hypothetical protein AAGL69_00605 [Pseudomonadota bacterium]